MSIKPAPGSIVKIEDLDAIPVRLEEEKFKPLSNALWRYDRIQELAQAITESEDMKEIKVWVHELKSLT